MPDPITLAAERIQQGQARRLSRPRSLTSRRIGRALALVLALTFAFLVTSVGAQAQPAPSDTSTVGDSVTNPLNSNVTTVTALVLDPAGTATAGDVAFVQTADGFTFLVKGVGDTFFNNANPPEAFLIADITGNDATISNDELDGDEAEFPVGQETPDFDDAINPPTPPAPPPNVPDTANNPSERRDVFSGDSGGGGSLGALLIPPGDGGDGDSGPTVDVTFDGSIAATGNVGWTIGSLGGNGGDGGPSFLNVWGGGDGGNAGDGGTVRATYGPNGTISTSGNEHHGIFAFSRSGVAGDGGDSIAATGGGPGGNAAEGSSVTVTHSGTIETDGTAAYGIYALSQSNTAGGGGDQFGIVGSSGGGGVAGDGGPVVVNVLEGGSITTRGDYSHGILAQSVGGSGGSSGFSGNLLLSLVGSPSGGGDGDTVTVTNAGTIRTFGDFSRGIFAQSLGGGGGNGGTGLGLVALALGGVGADGGSGDTVTVTNAATGLIETTGELSDGIMAQSIGGSGGAGSNAGGLVAIGGDGSAAGDGAPVSVSNLGTITTGGVGARGIVAQSIGGGGGDGGRSGAMVSIGGSGGGGGAGATVSVLNDGIITTGADDGIGILAQSIGGGGGNGGSSGAIGLFAGVAVGGSGATGGDGGQVDVTLSNTDAATASSIQTNGARATGVFAQSVGGGGGNGGGAVSVAVGAFGAAAVSVGGDGSAGGAGGLVTFSGTGASAVQTNGDDSLGVFAQSVGGGGGNGGYAVSAAASAGPVSGAFSVSVGGEGGPGGDGGEVRVGTLDGSGNLSTTGFSGSVVTNGARSTGMLFQSVGGGGGNGGLGVAVTAGGSLFFTGNVSVGVGGNGGVGGSGGIVRVSTDADVTTQGENSTAMLVQSVGGGGGNGGGSIAAGIAGSGAGSAQINVGVGGAGAAGAIGGRVDLEASGTEVRTFGQFSSGIVAQSVGGGGGNGGYSVAAGAAGAGGAAGAINVGVGGSAGGGSDSGPVTAIVEADVTTRGSDSTSVVVQSIGGGGGNGGFAVAAGIAGAGGGAATIGAALGGDGAAGGDGGSVTATISGTVNTGTNNSANPEIGDRSPGIVVQSLGGGGGNGGFSVSGSLAGAGAGAVAIDVGLGGDGAAGGAGGDVTATVTGSVTTLGADSTAILAQSVGGGGGSGGFNVSANAAGAGAGAGAITVGLGGNGSAGSDGGEVRLVATEAVTTSGDRSSGIVAQSIGGGGGNGGFNVAGSVSGAGVGSGAIGVGLGGSGGGGGDGGAVNATSLGTILTDGFSSTGFTAQSIGGGGGSGGFNVTAALTGAGTGSGAIGVGLGGSGDVGGDGGAVVARTTAGIETRGLASTGILVQSIGGGGGSGAFNITGTLAAAGTGAGAVSVGLGGSGAGGGDGGTVSLAALNDVLTLADQSSAVVVQSLGGGGGDGGFNVAAGLSGAGTGAGAVGVGLGGRGAGGGDGSTVISEITGNLATRGDASTGLLAQSLGGGGGNGGLNVAVAASVAGTGAGGASVGLGGAAGSGGLGGAVTSTLTGDVTTDGIASPGIIVQSLGGGGGNGGLNVSGTITAAGTGSGGAAIGLGGSGGDGGDGGTVSSTIIGDVTTAGLSEDPDIGEVGSTGVLVQSAGGGGGAGGMNVSGALNLSGTGGGAVAVGIGGAGGGGGTGGTVTSTMIGDVTTGADTAFGSVTQSLGGGGGNGGLNVSGAVSLTKTGSAAAAIGIGGFGGDGGASGDVTAGFTGNATTGGDNAGALVAQSVGGGGGNGGVNVSGAISLGGTFSGAVGFGLGGFGGGGGGSGSVDHTVDGTVATSGAESTGILTQSVGGGGGNGGTNITAVLNITKQNGGALGLGIGGFGGIGADAGGRATSTVTGTVSTNGRDSAGIVTQSIGGGGGNGGLNVTAGASLSNNNGGALTFGMGGFGGAGGDGGAASSTVRAPDADLGIQTLGASSTAVLAQSVGGGGGAGGTNVSGAASFSGGNGASIALGLGGFGGSGGNSGIVDLDASGLIVTVGNDSQGLVAQSIAGGGGAGGTNVAGSLALTKPGSDNTIVGISVGVGGFGGGGGDADAVTLSYSGDLQTLPMTTDADGNMVIDETSGADGIVAQSVGGGGGSGGVNVAAGLSISSLPGRGQPSDSTSAAVVVGVGGFGGTGGDAGTVGVTIADGTTIRSHGTGRSGIIAQSVGGGGGNGGLNVSGGVSSDTSFVVGVGGLGGNAGIGDDVTVTARADITVTTDPEDVETPTDDSFETKLRETVSDQVVDFADDLASDFGLRDLLVDLGLFNEDKPDTDGSAGLLAQSIGGGGGNGGLNVSGGVTIDKDEKIPSVTFGIGGFGGAGNVSGRVTVDHGGTIAVAGNWKHGLHAQSLAGGGGNGGMNIAGSLNYQSSTDSGGDTDLSIVAGLGGHGGAGADAGDVDVTSSGDIVTFGYASRGVFAQSIGGGGGTGGINITGVGTRNSSPVALGVGGFGANGGNAGDVTVARGTAGASAGVIQTDGIAAVGLEASSIGGGGGNAGVNAIIGVANTSSGGSTDSSGGTAGDRTVPSNTGVDASVITNFNAVLDELEGRNSSPENADGTGGRRTNSVVVGIGGSAGSAGNGGAVDVTHFGDIGTAKSQSHGVLGQSIGGGGGNAALNLALMFQTGDADNNRAVGLSIGGGAGDGGDGSEVSVAHIGTIVTEGDDSHAVFAQSVGGGGGNVGKDMLTNSADGGSLNVTIGRIGGTGGTGGDVFASAAGDLRTAGDFSHGLLAQSIGNGGGNSSTTSIGLGTPKTEDDKGTSLSMSVGLEGGQGGSAGDVEARAEGTIATEGTESHGVFAQSVGGGGGTAGSATGKAGEGTSISVAIGGDGGTGGTGGDVTVGSTAEIMTVADRAIGIFGQSVGGAGGTAGAAKGGQSTFDILSGLVSGSNIGTTGSLLIGGTGGSGMTSGTVDVDNDGIIVTGGEFAYGILAQSIGGGGGKGGVVETNIVNLRGTVGNQYTVGLGGDGGDGAVSDDVSVSNSSDIGTSGRGALGIFAQSVGGGGGDAQYVRDIVVGPAAENTTQASLLMGGTGGTGGAAGNVTVENETTARIITSGADAHGIFAQSVGGGGGTGADVSSLSLGRTTTGDAGVARVLQVGIGGDGGTGGTGGRVDVSNAGLIQTTGDAAHGIIAQSVGGGGGNGGQTLQGSFTLGAGNDAAPSAAFSLGGSGGSGNTGGDVGVTNSGNILVVGEASHGILAQSVGGGGGNGGLAIALAGSQLVDQARGTAFNSIAIGGAGGDGADGGDVSVVHTGTIQADGDNSFGILAQSVGGSGGNAGFSVSAPLVTALDYTVSTLLGARSGADGQAGAVTVTSTGDIFMNGANSEAILNQSINGGGGNVDVFTEFSENRPTGPEAEEGTTIFGILGLGGDDVDDTAAADVTASHTGAILTAGDGSSAGMLQAIGGGGGTATSTFEANDQTDLTLQTSLGATDTDNAGGGAIDGSRTGDVQTMGTGSLGGLAQSLGGGGGAVMLMSQIEIESIPVSATPRPRAPGQTQSASVALGASGGSGNAGGDIALDQRGDTTTLGDFAHGQVLQSIGAGGGSTLITGLSHATATLGGQGGASGDGGDLTFAHDGTIVTAGQRSHGVVLQSIGGGGGIVTTDLDAGAVTSVMSADNSGDGGAITFQNTGNVMTMGDDAVGILAQSLGGGGGIVDLDFRGSAGGSGAGDTVGITQAGNVLATGDNAIAVLSQSEGGTGAGGDMALSVGGVVLGGDGASGRAIQFDGGAQNSISLGDQSFLAALNNEAIEAGSGSETVTLAGAGVGNVDLGAGTAQSFTLTQTGSFTMLDRFLTGDDGQVRIEGDLAAGGELQFLETVTPDVVASAFSVSGNVNQSVELTGSLSFGDQSSYTVDVDFTQQDGSGDREGDLINASGDATIGGTLFPVLNSLEQAQPYVLIDAGGATADNGTFIQDTVVLDYEIGLNGPTGDGSTIDLNVTPDFSISGMNENQAAVGDYFSTVLLGDGAAPLGGLFALIGNLTEEEDVIDVIDRLTAEDYAATQIDSHVAGLRFADDVRTCSSNGSRRFVTENTCFWFNLGDNTLRRAGSFEYRSLTARSTDLQIGGQVDLENGYKLGLAFAKQDSTLTNGGRFSASADRYLLGASLEREINSWTLFGGLSGGVSNYDATRGLDFSGTLPDGTLVSAGSVETTQRVRQLNLRLGAEYRHQPHNQIGYVQPGLSLDITRLNSRSGSERGSDFGLDLQNTSQTVYTLTPSLEFGIDTDYDSNTGLQAYLRAEALFSSEDDLFVDARLPGTSAADGSFRNRSGLDDRLGRVAVGLKLFQRNGSNFFEFQYGHEFGGDTTIQTGSASFGIKF